MACVDTDIRLRAIGHWLKVDPDLGTRVAQGLGLEDAVREVVADD